MHRLILTTNKVVNQNSIIEKIFYKFLIAIDYKNYG